jgi:hypothetical protein
MNTTYNKKERVLTLARMEQAINSLKKKFPEPKVDKVEINNMEDLDALFGPPRGEKRPILSVLFGIPIYINKNIKKNTIRFKMSNGMHRDLKFGK